MHLQDTDTISHQAILDTKIATSIIQLQSENMVKMGIKDRCHFTKIILALHHPRTRLSHLFMEWDIRKTAWCITGVMDIMNLLAISNNRSLVGMDIAIPRRMPTMITRLTLTNMDRGISTRVLRTTTANGGKRSGPLFSRKCKIALKGILI